mgnify:CR=1 FL=1
MDYIRQKTGKVTRTLPVWIRFLVDSGVTRILEFVGTLCGDGLAVRRAGGGVGLAVDVVVGEEVEMLIVVVVVAVADNRVTSRFSRTREIHRLLFVKFTLQ